MNIPTQGPVLLTPNFVTQNYRGGTRIAELRKVPTPAPFQSEEWVGSTVSRFANADDGLAVTADGRELRVLIAANPTGWLGEHRPAAAADTGILLKLLDAGQRLPVHFHPNRSFANSWLGSPYGKSEAWAILSAERDAAVYLGWKRTVDLRELEERRDAQDGAWMLANLNRVEVAPGMGIFVPAGTAHAIGEGVLIAEIQEPTDFSILLEWSITSSTREGSHLGLGWDAAMRSLSLEPLSQAELSSLITVVDAEAVSDLPQSLLSPQADPYFRLEAAAPPVGGATSFDAGFSVGIVLSGEGSLDGAESLLLETGHALAIPHDFGAWRVSGNVRMLVARAAIDWPGSLQQSA